MDDADRAEQAEQWARDMAIAAARRQQEHRLPSRTHCKDCGFEIEKARQREGGAIRCVECEGFFQREQMVKGL